MGDKLDLEEKVTLAFTRRQWAMVCFGLSYLPSQFGKAGDPISREIQQHAAPIGVMSRILRGDRP